MPSPPSRPPNSPSDEGIPERTRPFGPRVLGVSLLISAVLHVVAVVVYSVVISRVEPPASAPTVEAPPTPPEGVEVVQLAEPVPPVREELEEPREPQPEETEPEPEETEPEPTRAEPEDAGAQESEESPRPSVAERLRVPESGDSRIWRPVNPALTELTPEQRARIRVYRRLQELADSTLTAEERARAARDWTYTDDEGRRWGVADGRVYLGDFSIPFPFSFSRPPTIEDGQLQWESDDIEQGARDALVRESWEERSEAIRERRDAERADSTGSGGGSGG